ncbi:zeta toxin family protein [Microbulbifer sp. CnH-101-E]|uniref:zeta toxin family protein n=1 Tax=unclassified Microbulbifer TaxID=2619833 RepID=UPI00403A0BD5
MVQEKLNRITGLGQSVDEPTIFAMRGNSGSGKSRFVNSGGVEGVESMNDIAVINPDEFKKLLIDNTKFPVTYDQVHAENSMLAKRVQAELLKQKDVLGKPVSFMVDKRLGDVEDIQKLVDAAQNTGRKLNVSDMDAPLEISLIGVLMRKPGGEDPIVPFQVVGETGFKPARENREKTIKFFEDNPELGVYELYGTSHSGDKKLVARVEQGELDILDQSEYVKLTSDPTFEMNELKHTEVDDAEIARITDPLPDGAWKEDVVSTLSKYKGRTWGKAIEEHGGFGD